MPKRRMLQFHKQICTFSIKEIDHIWENAHRLHRERNEAPVLFIEDNKVDIRSFKKPYKFFIWMIDMMYRSKRKEQR